MPNSGTYFGPQLLLDDGSVVTEKTCEIFEIDDFTSISTWEKFIVQLENVMKVWCKGCSGGKYVPQKEQFMFKQKFQHEFKCVYYHRFSFILSLFSMSERTELTEPKTDEKALCDDSSCVTSSFSSMDLIPISIWKMFGLTEFIVVRPNNGNDTSTETESVEFLIDDDSRVSMALSSVAVAAHNVECKIPIFIQKMEEKMCLFSGICVGEKWRTSYEMALISCENSTPIQNLSGLLKMFKESICQPFSVRIDPVCVSIRFTFDLNDWKAFTWNKVPLDLELLEISSKHLNFIEDFGNLPFGTLDDPISKLILTTAWCDVREEMIIDNDIHSDLEPMDAPFWFVRVVMKSNPRCLLSECVKDFIKLCCYDGDKEGKNMEGKLHYRNKTVEEETEPLSRSALSRLTGPSYTLSDIYRAGSTTRTRTGPLSDHVMSFIIEYLFPNGSNLRNSYPSDAILKQNRQNVELRGLKASPVDGLIWRIGIILCTFGQQGAFTQIWSAFIDKIRSRWESSEIIPGIPTGTPDHSYCLLHQKIQMINYCINCKISRQSLDTSESFDDNQSIGEEDEEEGDERFYDCREDEQPSVLLFPPRGRLRKSLNNLRLLCDNTRLLYEPIVQESSVMTEDQLFDRNKLLQDLGTDVEGSRLRADIQSVGLRSDMESFKAANPGCCLGDFVRWHSPRDWIDETGQLSTRMAVNSMWTDVWNSAEPVPACRQRRLFDDTQEAEMVFRYLRRLLSSEMLLSRQLLPSILTASFYRLKDLPNKDTKTSFTSKKTTYLNEFKSHLDSFGFKIECQSVDNIEESSLDCILQDIIRLETHVSRNLSLEKKFFTENIEDNIHNMNFVQEVMECSSLESDEKEYGFHNFPSIKVLGGGRGPTGQCLLRFSSILGDLRTSSGVSEREFILQTYSNRPYENVSKSCPQRFYARLSPDEFRIANAISTDKQIHI